MKNHIIKYTLQIYKETDKVELLIKLFHYLINQYDNIEIEILKKNNKRKMEKILSNFKKEEYKKTFFYNYYFFGNKQNIQKIIELLLKDMLKKGCIINVNKKQIFYFFVPLNVMFLNCYKDNELDSNKNFLNSLEKTGIIDLYEILKDETEFEEPEWIVKAINK